MGSGRRHLFSVPEVRLQGQAKAASLDLLSLAAHTSSDINWHPLPKQEPPKPSACFVTFSVCSPLTPGSLWVTLCFSCAPQLLQCRHHCTSHCAPLLFTALPNSHTTYFLPTFSATTIKQNTLPTRHRPARNSSCILDFSFLPASGSAAPRCGIASTAVSTTGLQPRWNPRLQIILKIVSPSYSSHSQPSSQGRKKSLKITNGKFQETSLPFGNHISCISELLFLK